jgi:hypothetical protein
VSDLDYILTVLSSGRPAYLERTLAAFGDLVAPGPSAIYVYDDGADDDRLYETLNLVGEYVGDATVEGSPTRLGMCAAHARCWRAAAESDAEWAFHLEDDYRILCPIDLRDLALVIDAHVQLAQMTLMRTPWGAEVEHGGYVPQSPGHYERHETVMIPGCAVSWFETTRNWAAAPTLFPTMLARLIDWPTEPGCETAIGPLVEEINPGARFGIWGAGECQVAHIGVERAKGSHGY